MKIYRASFRDNFHEHQGYEYFTSKAKAEKAQKKHNANQEEENRDSVEEIEFSLTKADIVSLLNQYAGHPDNG